MDPVALGTGAPRPSRILVVEDEAEIRSTLCEILEIEGFDVAQAENGNDAMRLFATNPTDLVVADLFMPEMDGIELIRELRRYIPCVPIIAMTGGYPTLATAALALGACAALQKPFHLKQFVEVVQRALASRV